jgi:hypothetical protein
MDTSDHENMKPPSRYPINSGTLVLQTANKTENYPLNQGIFPAPAPARDAGSFPVRFSSKGAVPGRDGGNYPVETALTLFAGRKFMDRESRQGS